MIGRLRGLLAAHHHEYVVLDVGGVGYEIAVPPRALTELPPIGEEAVLHTHLYVREDQLAMYGFATAADRDLFRMLIGVSGVGPKVAMAILATLTVSELRQAVASDDTAMLESVPGIGKRSAQKLILELRPKLEVPDGEIPGGTHTVHSEVRQALEGLGYQPPEIKAAVAALPATGDLQELLRLALQSLGKSA